MNRETNDASNDFKGVAGNRHWENLLTLNILLTCSGRCGHETLLEHVIAEASLFTWSIKLHSMLMNWMCFPLQVWGGGFAPPAKSQGVSGAVPPQPKPKRFELFLPKSETKIVFQWAGWLKGWVFEPSNHGWRSKTSSHCCPPCSVMVSKYNAGSAM